MKKTSLLTSLFLSSLTVNTAAAVDTTLFGEIQLGVLKQNKTDMDGSTMNFGFKAREKLENGMTGFMQIEIIHDAADTATTGFTNDVSYVGIKGDFGKVTLGKQSDAADFACGGTDLFNYNGEAACSLGATNDQLDNAITYVKEFDGVTVFAGFTVDGARDGTMPDAGNHALLAVNYEADTFSFGAQFTRPDSELNIDDWIVMGGTYKLTELVIGLTLSDNGTDSAIALGITFPLAEGEFVAAIDSGDSIDDEYNIGFHKNLSEAMYYGIEFTSWDVTTDDMLGVYLGMTF